MAFGQIDPARLSGEALRRWYLRSPTEIEDERSAAAERKYDAFFSRRGHVTAWMKASFPPWGRTKRGWATAVGRPRSRQWRCPVKCRWLAAYNNSRRSGRRTSGTTGMRAVLESATVLRRLQHRRHPAARSQLHPFTCPDQAARMERADGRAREPEATIPNSAPFSTRTTPRYAGGCAAVRAGRALPNEKPIASVRRARWDIRP